MAISREELLSVLTVVSYLVHSEREIHVAEKKVMNATFKAVSITPEERERIKTNTSLEEMLRHIQTAEAKHALVELMALVAASDGVFEEEERIIIQKIMKRIGVNDDHPYFSDHNLDVPSVRANVSKILHSFKDLAS